MALSWGASAGSSPSQAGHVSGPSTTGIRLCSSAHSSLGVVVMIAKLRTLSPAGQRQQPPVGQRDRIGLLPGRSLLPLVKVIDRHEAAATLECLAKGRPVLDPLDLGVDVREPDFDVFGPKGYEAQRITSKLRSPARAS